MISLYTLSFAGGALVLIAPLLVTLALKVNDLVGIDQAAKNLALVTGVGSLLAMVSNPVFGRLSDRTTARMGIRRPWMLVGLAGGTAGTRPYGESASADHRAARGGSLTAALSAVAKQLQAR